MIRNATLLLAIAVCGCSGAMKATSSDQAESLSMDYKDGFGTRDVTAQSSKGEHFAGTLVWIKDPGTSGRYKGALIGDKGRTLDVQLECNTVTTKCVGAARTESGATFFIK